MTNLEMVQTLDHALADIQAVRAQLASTLPPDPPQPTVIPVPAGSDLTAAVTKAVQGSILLLESGSYPVASLILAKSLTIGHKDPVPAGRATSTAPCWVVGNSVDGAIQVQGTGVHLSGIGIQNLNPNGDLVVIAETAADTTVDQCTGLGDPQKGQRRGIRVHGTRVEITRCYFDHIFAIGRDTCVIGGWNGGSQITIDDCYLCGGAEGIMFGGADSVDDQHIPSHIEILNSTITKRPEWYQMGVQIKNGFELKSARYVHVKNCLIQYAGINEGQPAGVLLFTVRNQSGKAPWSTIEHVVVEDCTCQYGGCGIQFLGRDTNFPSGTLKDVVIRNVRFTDLDPQGITKGTGRVFAFDKAPEGVVLEAITVEGKNLTALGYFANSPNQPKGLVLRNIKYVPTKYGWKVDGGGLDVPPASKTIQALMPDLVYEVTGADTGAQGTPAPTT